MKPRYLWARIKALLDRLLALGVLQSFCGFNISLYPMGNAGREYHCHFAVQRGWQRNRLHQCKSSWKPNRWTSPVELHCQPGDQPCQLRVYMYDSVWWIVSRADTLQEVFHMYPLATWFDSLIHYISPWFSRENTKQKCWGSGLVYCFSVRPYCNCWTQSITFGTRSRFLHDQGPLEHTTGDFWEMVWMRNSPLVIMLTREIEKDIEVGLKGKPASTKTSSKPCIAQIKESKTA